MRFFPEEKTLYWDGAYSEVVNFLINKTDENDTNNGIPVLEDNDGVFTRNVEVITFAAILGMQKDKSLPVSANNRKEIKTTTFDNYDLASLLWSLYFVKNEKLKFDLSELNPKCDSEVLTKIQGWVNGGLSILAEMYDPALRYTATEFLTFVLEVQLGMTEEYIESIRQPE